MQLPFKITKYFVIPVGDNITFYSKSISHNQFGEQNVANQDLQIVRLIVMDGAFDRNSSLLPIEVASFCSVEEPIVELASGVDPVS